MNESKKGNGGESYTGDLAPDNDREEALLGDKLESQLEDAGVEILDQDKVVQGTKELYLDRSIEEVIEKAVPRIQAADPQFFIRNQINLSDVTERLASMYANNPELRARYGNKVVQRIAHSFEVWLNHICFYMIDDPDKEQLQHSIDELRTILDGKWQPDDSTQHVINSEVINLNSINIPNIYDIKKEAYLLFESFDSTQDTVAKALPFLKEVEIRKITMTIISHSNELFKRVNKAKEVIERYLREARELVTNKDKPFPDYYDESSDVYTIIQRARNSYLV